jgi:hypothetical protein
MRLAARAIQKFRQLVELLASFDYPCELPLELQVLSHRSHYHSDLSAWIPRLHPAGLISMHDAVGSNKPGVNRAAGELIDRGWKVVANTASVVVFTRTMRLVEQTHRIS